jgi:predicted Fe-S protein YdhL (DUF1289 family)
MCVGCGRTKKQIFSWVSLTHSEKVEANIIAKENLAKILLNEKKK